MTGPPPSRRSTRPGERHGAHLPSDTDPATLTGRLDRVVHMIRVDFPAVADGRGFTIARQLRLMGYAGRLRAAGHVIADQYAMARRAGFDEVEISDDLALRQPEDQWLCPRIGRRMTIRHGCAAEYRLHLT